MQERWWRPAVALGVLVSLLTLGVSGSSAAAVAKAWPSTAAAAAGVTVRHGVVSTRGSHWSTHAALAARKCVVVKKYKYHTGSHAWTLLSTRCDALATHHNVTGHAQQWLLSGDGKALGKRRPAREPTTELAPTDWKGICVAIALSFSGCADGVVQFVQALPTPSGIKQFVTDLTEADQDDWQPVVDGQTGQIFTIVTADLWQSTKVVAGEVEGAGKSLADGAEDVGGGIVDFVGDIGDSFGEFVP